MALKSSACASKSSKYRCPEIFLDATAAKLTATAVLFLNVELLAEFYYHFPRELDARLGRAKGGSGVGISEADVERFAREDPRVARHLDVVRRKDLLELVLEKCEGLRGLETGREEQRRREPGGGGKKERRNWGFF